MPKTPRGRVYLLTEEKKALLALLGKLTGASEPGAWSPTKQSRRGRPSKGKRKRFYLRLPESTAERVVANAKLRGMCFNDYLLDVIDHGLVLLQKEQNRGGKA